MQNFSSDLSSLLQRLETRLEAMDDKLDSVQQSRKKSLEWIAQVSEHIRSLDDFREEVRASLEPLFRKLENIDDVVRILRHATSDVARRIDSIEVRKTG